MPRHAIGDLFVDLEFPERLLARYLESGALLVEDPGNVCYRIEVSGITAAPKYPLERNGCVKSVCADAATNKIPCTVLGTEKAFYRTRQTGTIDGVTIDYEHWIVGFGNRKVVITLSHARDDARIVDRPTLTTVVENAIGTLSLTHLELPATDGKIVIRDLTASQRPWISDQLNHLDARVQTALGLGEETQCSLEQLDEYWARFVAGPPTDNDELNTILNAVGAGFGAFLGGEKDFEWVVVTDAYGTYVGIVALRGTANVTIDPFNFVAKWWQRRESRFLVHAVDEIGRHVDRMAADWAAKETR